MIWKHLLLCGTLFASSFFVLPSAASACGWDPEWDNEFYRFMAPEMAGQEMYAPFQFTWDNLYSYNLMSEDMEKDANSKDWAAYFGNGISAATVEEVVYKMSPDDLGAVQQKADGQLNVLPGNISENALVRRWSKGEWRESLDYLRFAMECQPHCTARGSWDTRPANAQGADNLIEQGMEAYRQCKDDFVKLRYAYQVVRLLRYQERNLAAIDEFKNMALPLARLDNTVYWWTVSHYAGALRNDRQYAEAAYQFARVFDRCPTRRIAAYRGFRVNSDAEWRAVMQKCQNGREKATLHFIRAITPNALAMEEIRTIQALDPGSDMADVLLLREINKLEGDLLGFPFSSGQAFYKGIRQEHNAPDPGQITAVRNLVDETLKGKEMHDPDLWRLSRVYLTFLSGDMDGAASELEQVRPQLGAAGALRGSLLDLVFRIARTKKVDASVENTLLKDLTNLNDKLPEKKREEMRQFMDEALAWLYEAQGQPGKALLARRKQWTIDDAKLPVVNDLLKFEAKPNPTLYERQLLERLNESYKHEQLVEIKGTRLLGKNLLEEAIKVFNSLPEKYRSGSATFRLEADPFEGRIRDIVNCHYMGCADDKYTKLSLAETLLNLQKKAIQEPANAASYYHLLGNAYYNITFFGPAWLALDYHRSGGSWYYLGTFESWYQFDQENFDEVVDMSLAEQYYKKAAEVSSDPELAALSTFMAAKCEQNRYYMSGEKTNDAYRTHFAQLVRNYRNTRIYDQLVRECFYFRQYTLR